MTEIDHELETAILSWTRDEFIGYHVMILENKDDPGVRLVTIYDVDDSETVSTTKRVWEIINICESDYNVNVRKKFVYIPNIHSHSNTKRFFPHYERAKTVV